MSKSDGLFVGWAAKAAPRDRRFMVLAALGLAAGGAAAAAGFALRGPTPSAARWDQGAVRRYAGLLAPDPYPTLLTRGADGVVRPMLLVGYDKRALPRRPAGWIEVEASALTRGQETMLAVQDRDAFAESAAAPAPFAPPGEQDLGRAMRIGEILDAKCWFGAMNPGFGLTHKACAALCVRGGLPLAFCAIGECGAGEEVCLFLDQDGRPHGPEISPLLADPVIAAGRMMQRHGLMEFRVAADDLRRAV